MEVEENETIYAVSMKSTETTYEYHIYELIGDEVHMEKTVTFIEVHDMYPSEVSNASDALLALHSHAPEFFEN